MNRSSMTTKSCASFAVGHRSTHQHRRSHAAARAEQHSASSLSGRPGLVHGSSGGVALRDLSRRATLDAPEQGDELMTGTKAATPSLQAFLDAFNNHDVD